MCYVSTFKASTRTVCTLVRLAALPSPGALGWQGIKPGQSRRHAHLGPAILQPSGPFSNIKILFPGMGISFIMIRLSHDCLIFVIGNPCVAKKTSMVHRTFVR